MDAVMTTRRENAPGEKNNCAGISSETTAMNNSYLQQEWTFVHANCVTMQFK
jgi:hypothetical protein